MRSNGLFLSRIGELRRPFLTARYCTSHSPIDSGTTDGVSGMSIGWLSALILSVEIAVKKGCVIVPKGSVCIVERGSKYHRTLPAGFHALFPYRDTVSKFHSLRLRNLIFTGQHVVSKDNVSMTIESSLFYKVVDPYLATYEVKDLMESVSGVAKGIIRQSIGGISLRKMLQERDVFNQKIVMALCDHTKDWGVTILNFEIKDICMTPHMKDTMIMQASLTYKKSAQIFESEGEREWSICIAEGKKMAAVLMAKGEAEAVEIRESAKGKAISTVAKVLKEEGADQAVNARVLGLCIEAFGKIAEAATTIILPVEQKAKDK